MLRDETMKRFMLASTALVAATTLAHAGGVERSTQSVAILFEQGRYRAKQGRYRAASF